MELFLASATVLFAGQVFALLAADDSATGAK